MRHGLRFARWCWLSVGCFAGAAVAAPVDGDWAAYVDPMIGTGPSNAKDPVPGGAGGSVFPGASLPFGMVQWSPDTPHAEPSGYGFNGQEINGFSLTHFSGAGCANFDDLPVMPTVGVGNMQLPIAFSHDGELASPGYYSVSLANGVRVELTATTRTGFGRFSFPAGALNKNLLIDASRSATKTTQASVQVVGTQALTGQATGGNFCNNGNHFTLHFAAAFDQPFTVSKAFAGGVLLTFPVAESAPVQMKIALSYVSTANALENLAAESPGWDFAEVHSAARAQWNQRLSKIQVEGGTADATKIFYTALYHALLHPNVFSDVNGEYTGFDDRTYHATGYVQYANYSLWDTYRSQVQLLALLFPEETSDMMQSLVTAAEQCGALPKWAQANGETGVMVGDSAAPLIASAYAFGARRFDAAKALAFMFKNATNPDLRCNGFLLRLGLREYLSRGYIPRGVPGLWGGVATALEYNTDDFAIATLAHALGDQTSAATYTQRSLYWRNYFDPTSRLLRPRNQDGSWADPGTFGPATVDGYVEGNAGQYVWMVPYDMPTLIDKIGGAQQATAQLDHLFTKLNAGISESYFYMGNEPNFATPWLYPWAHAPWRTQDVVRRIMDEVYSAAPSARCRLGTCGQRSASTRPSPASAASSSAAPPSPPRPSPCRTTRSCASKATSPRSATSKTST